MKTSVLYRNVIFSFYFNSPYDFAINNSKFNFCYDLSLVDDARSN